MPGLVSVLGDLTGKVFVTDTWIIDRYIGDRLLSSGLNTNGQLGDSTLVSKSSPVQTVSGGTNWQQVSSGATTSAAIKTDGTLWLWGVGAQGQLGDSTLVNKSSPVQTVSGGTNWKSVSVGTANTAAIKTDGTLWLWGENVQGQLGDNTVVNKSSPVQTVSGGTNWKQVSTGEKHSTAAIKTDGTLWLWGLNNYGQLGDNTLVKKSSPVQTVSAGTTWRQVSAGYTTSAIKTDGTLWTWGFGTTGQLGDNARTNKSSPVQTVSAGTTWKQVSSFSTHVSALKIDGTLWSWGTNAAGQLGDNTVVSKSSPVQTVAAGTNWKKVSVGSAYTRAVKSDGTLWSWGTNTNGQLGDNTVVNKSSPVQTVAGGTNWKQVSTGLAVSSAITNGT
jgi:alpha-tubulin suppressor-like RCC1 family protein